MEGFLELYKHPHGSAAGLHGRGYGLWHSMVTAEGTAGCGVPWGPRCPGPQAAHGQNPLDRQQKLFCRDGHPGWPAWAQGVQEMFCVGSGCIHRDVQDSHRAGTMLGGHGKVQPVGMDSLKSCDHLWCMGTACGIRAPLAKTQDMGMDVEEGKAQVSVLQLS